MKPLVSAQGLELPGRLSRTDLTLAAGQLCCLVGPNGSGKTSLLHALAGIGRPSGTVSIGGVDPRRAAAAERQRLISYLPASREVAWPLIASDLIRLGADLSDLEIEPMLDALALRDFAGRRADRLSTGERSRVLVARALAPRPRLLLLDEPVANLDPLWQLKLLDLVQAQARSNGQAVLLAIHDLELAARYADRLLVMDAGRVIADGEPETFWQETVIATVFGIERVNGRWEATSRIDPPQPRSS
jgi:iron complex transport system ATP-binding protein